MESLLTVGCNTGASFAPMAFSSEVASRYRKKGKDIPIGWTLADSPEPIGSDGGVLLDAWGSLRLPFFNTTRSDGTLHQTAESMVNSTPEIRYGYYGLSKNGDGTYTDEIHTRMHPTVEMEKDYDYKVWLASMEKKYPNNFFSLAPPLNTTYGTQCQFSFSPSSSNKLDGYEDWMKNVTSNWEENQVIAPLSSTERSGYGRSKAFQPTFLFVIAITFLSVIALCILYNAVLYLNEKRNRKQQQMNRGTTSASTENDDFLETEEPSVAGKKFTFKSPLDIWLTALTKYPGLFLVVSLAVPCTLSYLGIEASNRTLNVNLDFLTYLAMDSDE
eukprot:2076930-Ditylum_brightwellii.AAC.1